MYALFTALPFVGHVNPLLRQAEELGRRGWRVAFAGNREIQAHVLHESPGLPFVDLGALGPVADGLRGDQEAASVDDDFRRGGIRILRGLQGPWPLMFDGLAAAIRDDRPDLVVVDLFTSAGMCAAEAAEVPYVVNNPDLLAALPVTLLPPADDLPFLFSGLSLSQVGRGRRLTAPLVRRASAAGWALTFGRDLNRLRRSRGLPPRSIDALLRDRLILVNGAFGVEYKRELTDHIQMVGPMLREEDVGSRLPADLDAWLSDGPPVVYVNLGTLAVAPAGQLEKMTEAFRRDDLRTLWILRDAQKATLPEPLPPTLRILAWGPPPVAVLAHPNVKAFVSHCGINSAYEAVESGTPVVGIPMFADQRDMAVRLADAGAGVWVNKTNFTPSALRDAVTRVVRDPAFAARTRAVRAEVARAGGIRRAADLIEASVIPATPVIPAQARIQ